MTFDSDLAPHPRDAAIPADEKGRPLDAHIFPSEHRLLAPDAVTLDHPAVAIGGKKERRLVLELEAVVRLCRIGLYPDNGAARLFEFGRERREVHRLDRADPA